MTEREAELEQQIEGLIEVRDDYKRQRDAYSARIGWMNEEKKALKAALLGQIDKMEEALGDMRHRLEELG